jgi:phenylalanyl-tRNA synthetase beta chain
VTLALVDPMRLGPLGYAAGDARVVELQNPLGSDRSVLRPTLVLGLLEVMATNVRRQATEVRLFEVGRVFEGRGSGQLPHEETRVAVAMTGGRGARSWHGGRARVDTFDVKGAVENVIDALGRGGVGVAAAELPYLEQGRGARLLVQDVPVGVIGEIHPGLTAMFDLTAPVFVAELVLDSLLAVPARPLLHRPLPRFPGVSRDLAVVVSASTPAADVTRVLRAVPSPILRRVRLFDVYTGEQVGSGRKSLAYSLLYQADDRTLTDAEVSDAHARIVAGLRAELGVEVRGEGSGA